MLFGTLIFLFGINWHFSLESIGGFTSETWRSILFRPGFCRLFVRFYNNSKTVTSFRVVWGSFIFSLSRFNNSRCKLLICYVSKGWKHKVLLLVILRRVRNHPRLSSNQLNGSRYWMPDFYMKLLILFTIFVAIKSPLSRALNRKVCSLR